MKQVSGIWLPDEESHFAAHPDLGKKYPVLDAALKFLPETRRRTAFDVGAHVGLWSRWLIKEFKSVHAFEPVKEYCDIFQKNVKTGTDVILHKFAVGDSYRKVSLKKFPDDTGRAHIDGGGHIEMWPLDIFAISDVDLIKIDVEGYELQVVKGARKILEKLNPVVVIEQRGCDVNNFNAERDEALKWLEDIGMKQMDQVGYDYVMGWPT